MAARKPTASSEEWMFSVIIRQRNEAASPMVCAASSVTIRVVPSRSRNTITGSRPSGRGMPGFSVAKT